MRGVGGFAYLAVRIDAGLTLLRERPAGEKGTLSRRLRQRLRSRAIDRLGALFALLFAILAVQQIYVQVIEGPKTAASALNPRHQNPAQDRGEIVASDGTVLAESVGPKRVYPQGALLAHAVGYVSARYGTAGLEQSFDRFLTAPDRRDDPWAHLRAIVDPSARQPPRGAWKAWSPHRYGNAARAGCRALHLYPRGARGSCSIPRRERCSRLASVPSFDPNRLDATFPELRSSPASPLLDRSTGGLYPPGSTFKIFTAAAALSLGVVTPESTFVDDGTLPIGNYTVHDDELQKLPVRRTWRGRVALSSNVDFAQIALRIETRYVGSTRRRAGRWGHRSISISRPSATVFRHAATA